MSLTIDLPEDPGIIQVVTAVYVPDQGWVHTAGGPLTNKDGSLEERVLAKAKQSYQALIGAMAVWGLIDNPYYPPATQPLPMASHGNSCPDCGGLMIPTGSCEACSSCGTSGGCS